MIIEIALGIVLAVLILRFLPQILALGVVAVGIVLVIVISISAIALGINHPTFGIFGIAIATAVAAQLWTSGVERSRAKEHRDNEVEGKQALTSWSDELCDQCGGSFNPLAMRRCQCPPRQHSALPPEAKD